MKKLVILAVLACMVMGYAASASAVDLEAKGQIQFQMNLIDNADFLGEKDGGNSDDDLNFWFRARTEFRFVANENLWAVLYTEYKNRLGNGHINESSSDNDDGLYVKRAYLQYRFPGTEVLTSAGILSVNMPGAVTGSMILGDSDLGTFMVETPITDQVAVAGAFIRYADDHIQDGVNTNEKDELDIFYAAAPITLEGISATPYFMYSIIGKDVAAIPAGLQSAKQVGMDKNSYAWWLGTSFEMDMFDPIVFAADIAYGSVEADAKENDRSGLMFDASLAYTGLNFVQPKLKFAYSTGEDDKTDNGSERLPTIANDWDMGSYYFGASGLTGTGVDLDDAQQVGLWTVGLAFENISFFEKLSHTINIIYAQGTNDEDLIKNNNALNNISADGKFLTTKDHVFAVDFNTNYQIYDELAAIVEFGYAVVDLDEDVWQNYTTGSLQTKQDPNFKLALGLVYKF
ncbi:outer membrane homotrimeric porin [Maridesulfovibrio sp.]|uniref:outer membrane homotrimeric porin n=1 Tax=Maridesulfovibrio sp. TaxID=2795000 RepID=UPI003BA862A2